MKNTEEEPEEEAEGAAGEEADATHMEVDEEKVVVAPVATPASKKKAARAAIKVNDDGAKTTLFVIFHKTSDSIHQSTELTRGPPELVLHFRLYGYFISAQERCMS
jgi:hypothetical protein